MRCTRWTTSWVFVALLVAGVARGEEPAKSPEFKLPEGWTAEDLQACMLAGAVGEQHKLLQKDVGEWSGTTTMWMAPGAEPTKSECTCTCTSIMDGRFVKTDFRGEMPGMGPYHGGGLTGFDNVGQKYNGVWIDNHSTGMMIGEGERSSDGKTLNWKYTFNCPITKKPAVSRQVETWTSDTSKTLEMFGTDPKTGKEFQMMKIELTKK